MAMRRDHLLLVAGNLGKKCTKGPDARYDSEEGEISTSVNFVSLKD